MIGHEVYMRRCFELAQLAKGSAAPNPMVGAVLVHNDRIIAKGIIVNTENRTPRSTALNLFRLQIGA